MSSTQLAFVASGMVFSAIGLVFYAVAFWVVK